MPYYQCFVYNNTAIVTEENTSSLGGPTGFNSFETGNVTAPTKSPSQPLFLYEYTGTKSNGSTDGSINASTDDVAIESYRNRIDTKTLSVLDISTASNNILADQENYWFNYILSSPGTFNLPSLSVVPEDFEISITNRSANKSRVVVNTDGSDLIDNTHSSKILSYGSWARIKAYSSGWIIAYEVNQNHSSGDGNNPGNTPDPDEIVFDRNLTVTQDENNVGFKYIGAPASILTLPNTTALSSAWSIKVTNNSVLGSVLSVHTDNAGQTIEGSQIYYLSHGETKNINYVGTGTAFTISDVSTFNFDNQLTQATNGQVLKFGPQTDGALGWGPSNENGLSNVIEDLTPQLGGDLDVGSHTITSSIGDTTISAKAGDNIQIKNDINFDSGVGLIGTYSDGSTLSSIQIGTSDNIVTFGPRPLMLRSYEINSTSETSPNYGLDDFPDHQTLVSTLKNAITLTAQNNISGSVNESDSRVIIKSGHDGSLGQVGLASEAITLITNNITAGTETKKPLLLTVNTAPVASSDVSLFKEIIFNDISGSNVLVEKNATGDYKSATRPVSPAVGSMFFDTSLAAGGKPIWYTGTDWVDATGVVV